MVKLPAELRGLIVSYLPNNQALQFLAQNTFNNGHLNHTISFDPNEYSVALGYATWITTSFNGLLARSRLNSRVVQFDNRGVTNFAYQPGDKVVSNRTLALLITNAAKKGLIWTTSTLRGSGLSNLGSEEKEFLLEDVIDINNKLFEVGSPVRLVLMDIKDERGREVKLLVNGVVTTNKD